MFEFKQLERGYMVLIDGEYRGKVEKLDSWTTRGSSISWIARGRSGSYRGTDKTRIGAAMLLKAKVNQNEG